MAAWRLIKIQPNLYNRLEGQVRCLKCGEPLFVGEKAWAHFCPRNRDSYTEYYCITCFSRLWI